MAWRRRWLSLLTAGGLALAAVGVAGRHVIAAGTPPGQPRIATTINDYFVPGTQPDSGGLTILPIVSSEGGFCTLCHGHYDEEIPPLNPDAEPVRNWVGSMMAQASRDPVFYACLTIANQDAGEAGDLCIRCHAPGAWLAGRSTPTDASGFIDAVDFDGVTCHFCHRMVNPVYVPGESPKSDLGILQDLAGDWPEHTGNGAFVVDPMDVRRGPFDPAADPPIPYNPHFPIFSGGQPPLVYSPFHRQSAMCATCHDVSNPLYTRAKSGEYVLNALGAGHPTADPADMFPLERTFSEWASSQFATTGVQLGGRFGGHHATGIMATCQDCHMPDTIGPGCRISGFPERQDEPQHAFNGGNTWVLRAIKHLYEDGDAGGVNDPVFYDQYTGLTDEIVESSIDRAVDMLRSASDIQLKQFGLSLRVRVINFSGHKLPTGYGEGRQMWLNVKFYDDLNDLITEHGAYDFDTAELMRDTKVYEVKHGLDTAAAGKAGLSPGESFHFILNNVVLKDNRIPPIGFTNAAFQAVQAEPVGAVYADGQHWDDTVFAVPKGAARAVVTLYFQLTSREYIEFLRDQNVTDDRGQIAYDQWVLHGRSAPVDMDSMEIQLNHRRGDTNGDGVVNIFDLLTILGRWGACPMPPKTCPADVNGDGWVNVYDLLEVLGNWG
jgi:hypothetical protein